MPQTRRSVLSTIGLGVSAAIAGCSSGGQSSGQSQQNQPNQRATTTTSCHYETRTRENTVVSKNINENAGHYTYWNISLNQGDQLWVKVVTVSGSHPTLIVKNPNGNKIMDTNPNTSSLTREFTASKSGKYYILLKNRAIVTGGTWDVTMKEKQQYQAKVCS